MNTIADYIKKVCLVILVGTIYILHFSAPSRAITVGELLGFWNDRYGSSDFDEFIPRSAFPSLTMEKLAKAEPDGCYYDIGDSANTFDPNIDPETCYASFGNGDGESSQSLPGWLKVNQAYVWGLTKVGDNIWFGTMSNTHCLVMGSYLGETDPIETSSYVCEFGANHFSELLPDAIGDWRPPRIFVYDIVTGELEEKSQDIRTRSPNLMTTLGIRSAGSLNDVVILGGPALASGGVNLFAFNGATGDFLGATILENYSNIRKWLVVNGVLYTAVGGSEGGAVLKWTGNADDPFDTDGDTNGFTVVGTLDSAGVELALHEDRIFVTTWPSFTPGEDVSLAGLFMSPVVPPDGLPDSDDEWEKVWQVDEYEPDPLTAATYGSGALASYGGYLYWGTMHVPLFSLVVHNGFYSQLPGGYPAIDDATTKALLGTYRPITIFRGRNFGAFDRESEENPADIDLLYGFNEMPVFIYSPATSSFSWEIMPNNMGGAVPLYGEAGFDNFFNNYTWTMAVFNGQLFVGTMDFSYLLSENFMPDYDLPLDPGADLMRFPSSDSSAIAESITGVGNNSNYGVRTIIADDALYLGMANPMNLLTDQNDDLPEGGWELLKLDVRNIDAGGEGGGGGGGIFGDIIKGSVIGYHLDGFSSNGVQIYMPVTRGFKALKGAQEYVRGFAPDLAEFVRECFDFFERKADANKDGLLYNIGTHVFPVLGRIAEESLELLGEEKFIDEAYSDTTISVENFKDLERKGLAVAPKIVKEILEANQKVNLTEVVY